MIKEKTRVLTETQCAELRVFILDIHRNSFASKEIQAMGGIRTVLSDETLDALGMEIERDDPLTENRIAAMRLLQR